MKKRKPFQFSLRTLLIVVLTLGVLLGWISAKLNQCRRQLAAVSEIEGLGGAVLFEFEEGWDFGEHPEGPGTKRRVLGGGKAAGTVKEIYLRPKTSTKLSRATWKWIGGLEKLAYVDFCNVRVGEEAIVLISSLPNLEVLVLEHAQITDSVFARFQPTERLTACNLLGNSFSNAGLPRIAQCRALTRLNLSHSQVTDAGVPLLLSLPRLRYLNLGGTAVTDAGVETLVASKEIAILHLDNTSVTDDALRHVKSFPNLKQLYLHGTEVSDQGVTCLSQCPRLEHLVVTNTRVSERGVRQLQRASPDLRIIESMPEDDPFSQ